MKQPRLTVLTGIILATVASRLIPHPPNFTPVAALALFGGASFARKRAALLVPLAGMFLSDLVLGLSRITPVVYASLALIAGLGFWLRRSPTIPRTLAAAVAGAGLFFVVTNFGVWALGTLYPKTWAGLAECFVAAIPFFRNTLVSDLLYSALLFGGFALAEKRWPVLVETVPATA
jgi:hypothetical protein